MRRSKLFRKTLLLMFLLFGVISFSSSVLSAWVLRDMMTTEFISKGEAIASSVASSSAELVLSRDPSTIQSVIDQYLDIASVSYVFVRDGYGDVVSHTFVPQIPEEVDALVEDPSGRRITRLEVGEMGKVIDISAPILAGAAGFVHVGMDAEVIQNYIVNTILKMQGLMFFIFWGSVAILYYVVRRIARPLHSLSEYASKLAKRDWSASVDIQSKDEIGMLANTMSFMARELSELVCSLEREVISSTGELGDTKAHLQTIMDTMADGLLVVDMAGRISHANPALAKLFKLDDMEIRGMDAATVFDRNMLDFIVKAQDEFEGVLEAEVAMPGGRVGKIAATAIHAGHEDSKVQEHRLGTTILVRDITVEKEVDEMKTEFISTVSHELRTPLTSILGFAKVIRRKMNTLGESADMKGSCEATLSLMKGNMDIIMDEGKRLSELINDVLDVAKMESGKVQWKREDVDVAEVVEHTLRFIEPAIHEKGLSVVKEMEHGLPRFRGDRGRIVQVMINLLSNAIKFTERGSITCRVWRQDGDIMVEVEDTGIGIASQDLEAVFDRFRQVGPLMTDKPSGTGLGLTICREIVEHHGGTIRAESRQGRGSVFRFNLPLSFKEEGAA